MDLDLYKNKWQDRVVAVLTYHTVRLCIDKSWSIRKTAKELNRSIGSISQDIQLAEFLRSHDMLKNFKNYVDAIEWMKKKKAELEAKNGKRPR